MFILSVNCSDDNLSIDTKLVGGVLSLIVKFDEPSFAKSITPFEPLVTDKTGAVVLWKVLSFLYRYIIYF